MLITIPLTVHVKSACFSVFVTFFLCHMSKHLFQCVQIPEQIRWQIHRCMKRLRPWFQFIPIKAQVCFFFYSLTLSSLLTEFWVVCLLTRPSQTCPFLGESWRKELSCSWVQSPWPENNLSGPGYYTFGGVVQAFMCLGACPLVCLVHPTTDLFICGKIQS